MKKLEITAVFTLLLSLFVTSCYEPSPLYGTWADNNGNKISFMADGTFVATVYDSFGEVANNGLPFQGSYSVIENVLVFTYQPDGETKTCSMNTEWDIRGAMLYCTWTINNDDTQKLTLYHISK